MCDGEQMRVQIAESEDAVAADLAAELHIVIGALSRRLREQADVGDLTSAQKSVLLRLERDGPTTGSALARVEAMRPQSMGAIIAALEAAGYVSGAPDPADGRQTLLSLTDRFRDWIAAARGSARLAGQRRAGATDGSRTGPVGRRREPAQAPDRSRMKEFTS